MKQSRQENMIYLAVWGLLFAAPLLSLYVRTMNDASVTFDWKEIFVVWQKFAVYLLLFLVHNFLLAPLLVHKRKRLAYFSFIAMLIGAFAVYQCSNRPEKPSGPPPHEMMRRGGQEPPDRRAPQNRPPSPDRPHRADNPDFPAPPHRANNPDFPAPPHNPDNPAFLEQPNRPEPPHNPRPDNAPPLIVGERDILAFIVLILMLAANLGVKNYFRSRDDRKRLAELEKQNLEQQLEYLRYQINPHFFMNTLNNIHALVDIDPAKAQETIVELSKMMRFVLYEGDKHGVPLTKDMEFIRTYVKLMQLRYTDNVSITLDLPAEMPDRSIPPLMLISFIENAFKHGISYQHKSFIDIKVAISDWTLADSQKPDDKSQMLHFLCRNSKADNSGSQPQSNSKDDDTSTQTQKGGVGLANVRKRLDLLYEHNYTLNISDDADIYTVDLLIPI